MLTQQFCSPQETATRTITHTAHATSSAPAAATTSGGKLLNYVPTLPSSIYNVALDCPSLNGQVYTTNSSDQTFQISCEIGLYGGDIVSFVSYTLEDCIESCGTINHYSSTNGYTGDTSTCTVAEFHSRMGTGDTQSNCWLKWGDTTLAPQTSGDAESLNLAASAKLINA